MVSALVKFWLLKVWNLSEVRVPLNPTFRLWVPVT